MVNGSPPGGKLRFLHPLPDNSGIMALSKKAAGPPHRFNRQEMPCHSCAANVSICRRNPKTAAAFPIILIIIGFCLMNVFVGFFLYKTTKFSLSTALLSASPGGMSDISLMAEDLGANGPQVASMQFLRAIFIVGVYPIIIKILFS